MAQYRPLHGSVAYRVCLALISPTAAPISEDTIAAEEKKPTSWVSAVLAESVSTGWLLRRRNPDRQMVYMAGPVLSFDALQNGPGAEVPASPPAAEPVAGRVAVAAAKVNFSAIVIRTDEAPPAREDMRGPASRWDALLGSMVIGGWFELPIENLSGARKAVQTANKRKSRGDRVWEAYRSAGKCVVACRRVVLAEQPTASSAARA